MAVVRVDSSATWTLVEGQHRPVLVIFTATWSGPDRELAKRLPEIAVGLDGIALVATVDIDENPALAERFGIKSVPTLVRLHAGRVEATIVGAVPNEKILSMFVRATVAGEFNQPPAPSPPSTYPYAWPGFVVDVPVNFRLMLEHAPSESRLFQPVDGVENGVNIAFLTIRRIPPFSQTQLIDSLRYFENPAIYTAHALHLQFVQVTQIHPYRTMPLDGGTVNVREFEGLNANGMMVRASIFVVQGPKGVAVEFLMLVALVQWPRFMGPLAHALAGLRFAGVQSHHRDVRVAIDPQDRSEVRYQIVMPGHAPATVSTLPTVVQNITVINIDDSIKVGSISGVGIAIGRGASANVENEKTK